MNPSERAIIGTFGRVFRDNRVLVAQLDRALEKTRVKIENVARIRLTAGRPAQQQRELAVGLRLFGEIIVDNQRVLALAVHEVLGHGRTRVGSDVLKGRRIRGARRHDNGVVHGTVLLKLVHDAGHRRLLQTNRDIDADDVAALLVEDGVDGDRGLTGLAVTDNELALGRGRSGSSRPRP